MVGGRNVSKQILDDELSFFIALLDLLRVDFENSVEMGILLEILFFLQHVVIFGFVLCAIDLHAFVDLNLIG